ILAIHFDDHPCYEICYEKTYSAEVMHKPSRDRDRKFDFTVQPPICTALYEYNRPRAAQRCENSFALAISHASLIGETSGFAGRPCRHVSGAVSEGERRREIVSHTLGAQFREDWKIEDRARDCEPATNGIGGEVHVRDRAIEKIRSFE